MSNINDAELHGCPDQIFAFVAVDSEGKSGICAGLTPLGVAPMVGMTISDMEKWVPSAHAVSVQTDKLVQLIRYESAEIIMDFR